MNDRSRAVANESETPLPSKPNKQPYSAPQLIFFGDVALLTQADTGCDNNDNKACAGINGRQNKNG
jgi:hypothetical protein